MTVRQTISKCVVEEAGRPCMPEGSIGEDGVAGNTAAMVSIPNSTAFSAKATKSVFLCKVE